MHLLKALKTLLERRFGSPKAKHSGVLKVIPISNAIPSGECRTITYGVFENGKRLGTAKVEYIQAHQKAIIHNVEIVEDARKQGVGSYLVGWIIANTPYKVGTLYEWVSAQQFWAEMRNRHGWRMLPPPAMSG